MSINSSNLLYRLFHSSHKLFVQSSSRIVVMHVPDFWRKPGRNVTELLKWLDIVVILPSLAMSISARYLHLIKVSDESLHSLWFVVLRKFIPAETSSRGRKAKLKAKLYHGITLFPHFPCRVASPSFCIFLHDACVRC